MDQYQPGHHEAAPQGHYNRAMASDEQMGGVEEHPPAHDSHFSPHAHARPQTSHSADFPMSSFTPHTENAQFPSPNMAYQQQSMQSSRPSSGLGGTNGQGYNGQAAQDPRAAQQEQSKTQSSVVIKVGMVGDAQIGKTSLMVKYVEGAWDEDYIQTLGRSSCPAQRGRGTDMGEASTSWKRPSRYGTRRSRSQSGILAASVNSSTCCHLSATTPSPSCLCST